MRKYSGYEKFDIGDRVMKHGAFLVRIGRIIEIRKVIPTKDSRGRLQVAGKNVLVRWDSGRTELCNWQTLEFAPNEDEIKQRCMDVRSKWSDYEENVRRGAYAIKEYEMPHVCRDPIRHGGLNITD